VKGPASAIDSREGSPFLFSVDLEDVRSMIPEGMQYRDAVPRLVEIYLDFLRRYQMHCTFFLVGDIARRYPGLVRDIAQEGHELACHGSDHIPIPRMDAEGFRDDLLRNIDDIRQAADVETLIGFRAPTLSMTPAVPWAFEVLHEVGIAYSSSVLPAWNPLFGWAGFVREPARIAPGIWELPISLTGLPLLDVPFASGVYLRVLPLALQRIVYRRERRANRPIVMYCHPYDIDTEQERFWHPELEGRRFYNWLMYYGRAGVLKRLEALLAEGGRIIRYDEYVQKLSKQANPPVCLEAIERLG